MNEDFFENYNHNPEPKDSETTAEETTPAPKLAEEQPMTELYSDSSQDTHFYDAYARQTFQQPAQTPSYTNPYADMYKPHQVDANPAHPVYQSVDSSAYPDGRSTDDGFYHRSFTRHDEPEQHTEANSKKSKSGIGKGTIAAIVIICILLSGAAGFGGSILASKLKLNGNDYSGSDALVVHKVEAQETSAGNTTVDKTTAEITDIAANAVVEITTEVVQTSDFYGQYITQGAGSGVIISDDGTIITNNHVISGAKNITVTLRSGESYEAELIGADAELDIALIKIDAKDKELSVAVIGDSGAIEVGDKAVIIGNPLGTLGGSVTEGIVSALDRKIVVGEQTMSLMQTDAAINAGNSGGGMFNGQGELVGIVVAKNYSGEVDNIGFVIPINNAMNILGDLKQYGYVRGKVDTGMTFIDLSNQLYTWYYYGTSEPGCYVSSVSSNSNAERAGFRSGDRIISVDGSSISAASDIDELLDGKSVGDEVSFEVERNGRTGTLTLTLEEKIPETSQSSRY